MAELRYTKQVVQEWSIEPGSEAWTAAFGIMTIDEAKAWMRQASTAEIGTIIEHFQSVTDQTDARAWINES